MLFKLSQMLFFLSLFRTIFGDRGGGSPFGNFGQAAQQQQEFDFGPKEYQVSLTFQQAARGVNKEMHVSIMDNCPRCTGTGSEPGSRPERCPSCNGEGKIQCTALSIIYVLIISNWKLLDCYCLIFLIQKIIIKKKFSFTVFHLSVNNKIKTKR